MQAALLRQKRRAPGRLSPQLAASPGRLSPQFLTTSASEPDLGISDRQARLLLGELAEGVEKPG